MRKSPIASEDLPEGDITRVHRTYSRRMLSHFYLLRERAGLPEKDASKAILDPDPNTKQAAALWLRGELASLREQEKVVGAAPVLNEKLLSRLVIADLAVAMLGCCNVGDDLIDLFAELLDVDRHRKALADNHSERKQRAIALEAQTELSGRKLGVRELARAVSVSPATISTWRKSREFRQQVESRIATLARPAERGMHLDVDRLDCVSELMTIGDVETLVTMFLPPRVARIVRDGNDSEADDRLKAALDALGDQEAEDFQLNTMLEAARRGLMACRRRLAGAG